MKQITIAGRSFCIEYNMLAMLQMEESIGRVDEVTAQLQDKSRAGVLFRLIVIMAAACGDTVEYDWLMQNVKPAYYLTLHITVLDEISKGMDMQGDPADEIKVVDLGLREIKKKMGQV